MMAAEAVVDVEVGLQPGGDAVGPLPFLSGESCHVQG
jgi:hypothetical protein